MKKTILLLNFIVVLIVIVINVVLYIKPNNKLVSFLRENSKCTVHCGGSNKFIYACEKGKIDKVKKFIEDGVDVNMENGAPLVVAAINGNTEVVKELLKAKADVNKQCVKCWNMSALMGAAAYDHADVVQLLLDKRADVNLQGNEQYTALDYVAHNKGSLEIVQKLLKAGADPNIKNQYGDTALMLAIDKENLHLVPPLLKAGADANAESNAGFVPLIQAARIGDVDTVKVLLEYGADINYQAKTKKDTALILAADNNHLDVIKFLLNAGADPSIKNVTGKNAAGYARQRGYKDIEKFLTDAEM